MKGEWPFEEGSDTAAISQVQAMDGSRPILFVSHSSDDGLWQFLTGETATMADALVVGLGTVLKVDSSIGEVADLPEGWVAVRKDRVSAWERIGPGEVNGTGERG